MIFVKVYFVPEWFYDEIFRIRAIEASLLNRKPVEQS